MHKYHLSYKSFGEKAILIEWPSRIDEVMLQHIVAFKNKIEEEVFLQDIIVGYNSLLLVSDFNIENVPKKIRFLKEWFLQLDVKVAQRTYHWEIPVCYDVSFGIDLDAISKQKNLSIKEIIALHTNTVYTVFFIGFLPGFLYLGGLNNLLTVPRKASPRLRVPKGAVAIGGSQTGVYPTESSGGWHIIGNSPISFFDVENPSPCFAKIGDKVSFKSISLKKYKLLEKAIENKKYRTRPVL